MPATGADEHTFRDSLATVDQHGRRIWVYPDEPSGRYYTARKLLSYVLLAFLFAAPFLKIAGNPLLQFDIVNRRFFIFGASFWPQDFYLFVLSVIALVVFIILFTAAFGRLFCGWVCPQTVFMEMLFRRIEFLIEGSGARQRAFDRAPMTPQKFARKALKHTIFFALSFVIGNVFLAYFIGGDALIHIVTSPVTAHPGGLTIMVLFSLTFYGVFARFREQVCTLVCPYGRLQSVLLDDNSIVVAYDFKRGEPRGHISKSAPASALGDCIDCNACVTVCPTGIDIRNGTQLECIHCTACMDACDRIMTRVSRPKGLIRYSSMSGIAGGRGFRVTPRIILYTVVFTALVALISFLVAARADVETTILRAAGSLYEQLDDGRIRNLYTVKILNKTARDQSIQLTLKGVQGQLEILGPPLNIPGRQSGQSVFTVVIPPDKLYSATTMITVEVRNADGVLEEIRTNFAGPEPKRGGQNQ